MISLEGCRAHVHLASARPFSAVSSQSVSRLTPGVARVLKTRIGPTRRRTLRVAQALEALEDSDEPVILAGLAALAKLYSLQVGCLYWGLEAKYLDSDGPPD